MAKNKKNIFKSFFFGATILILLFVSSNLSLTMGIESRRTTAIIPIMLYILYQLCNGSFLSKKIDAQIKLIIVVGILATIVLSMFPQGDFKYFLSFSVTPFIIYAYLDQMTMWEQRILKKCILLLLFVEIGIAIYERATYSILIDISDELVGFANSNEKWSFRSQALFGHALANSLIVSTINIFILASNSISNRNKYLIFFLTLIAVLCFNSRGNIIIVVVFSIPFLYSIYKEGDSKIKLFSWLFVGSITYFVVNLQNIGLGGRLFNISLSSNDSSTMARFEAFDIFEFLDIQSILWGQEIKTYLMAMAVHTNASYVENGFIAVILRFGIVFGIPLLVLMVKLQYTKLSGIIFWKKILILASFYFVGFTNPHLTNPIQWIIFFLSFYAFIPNSKSMCKKAYGDLHSQHTRISTQHIKKQIYKKYKKDLADKFNFK